MSEQVKTVSHGEIPIAGALSGLLCETDTARQLVVSTKAEIVKRREDGIANLHENINIFLQAHSVHIQELAQYLGSKDRDNGDSTLLDGEILLLQAQNGKGNNSESSFTLKVIKNGGSSEIKSSVGGAFTTGWSNYYSNQITPHQGVPESFARLLFKATGEDSNEITKNIEDVMRVLRTNLFTAYINAMAHMTEVRDQVRSTIPKIS
jgi:hypothetical protein